eukprot:4650589-Heterocapsa_arctica.AAC.1
MSHVLGDDGRGVITKQADIIGDIAHLNKVIGEHIMTARDYHDDVMRTINDSIKRLEALPEGRGSSKDSHHVANTQPEAELTPAHA